MIRSPLPFSQPPRGRVDNLTAPSLSWAPPARDPLPTSFLMLRVPLTVTFVYNYYYYYYYIIFFNLDSCFWREGRSHPPPSCTPPAIFSGHGGPFFCGKGGHFARCTHMLQEGVGGPPGLGKGQVPAEPCMRSPPPSPPHPPGNNQKSTKRHKPLPTGLGPQVSFIVGLCSGVKVRPRLWRGLCCRPGL